MTHIFISYSRKDKEFAQRLVAQLEKSGYPCWIDTEAIEGGQKWVQQINEALKNALCVILVLSGHAQQSDFVSRELGMADALKKLIIPVRLEATEPSIQTDHLQFIDFQKQPFDKAFKQLIAALPPLEKPLRTLPEKLTAGNYPNLRLLAIGAVYADVAINTYHEDDGGQLQLKHDEERTGASYSARVGGSSWLVAQKLAAWPKMEGHVRLITQIGDTSDESEDPYAKFVAQTLRDSRLMVTKSGANVWWKLKKHTAVTYIVNWTDHNTERGRGTMITAPGVIAEFSWPDVEAQIAVEPGLSVENNVVYIAGFFKTALHLHLQRTLAGFDQKQAIVVLNPGRFSWVNLNYVSSDDPADALVKVQAERQKALRDSFSYVDLYLASGREFEMMFWDIFHDWPRFSASKALKVLGERADVPLPKAMCIRDTANKKVCIFARGWNENQSYDIPVELEDAIFSGSKFDARFLYRLFELRTEGAFFKEAGDVARACAEFAISE
ncbi:MAG: toll/interleukin-1 receptor domain-containing protein [Chloroflexi bacterium]|nr:toll/interleukin-1 receptor domain-containing protein [Chloroflexota bacterium]